MMSVRTRLSVVILVALNEGGSMPSKLSRGQKIGIGDLALAGTLMACYSLGRVSASSAEVETIEIPPF